jgi:hypothetical protein
MADLRVRERKDIRTSQVGIALRANLSSATAPANEEEMLSLLDVSLLETPTLPGASLLKWKSKAER